MDLFTMHTEEYYKKLIELQEKLRKSEEERLKLEMKFNEMIQQSREDEQKHYRKLRTQYKHFLDEDRKRQNRNEKILISLDRIENRVAVLKAKSERFKLLRDQYHAFVTRIYRMQNVVKRNDEEMNCMKQMPKEEIDDKLNGWKNEAAGDYFESIIKRPNYANAIADDIINEIYAKQTANESICNNEEIEELKSIVNDEMSEEMDKSMRLNEDESSKEQVELLLEDENNEENDKVEEIDVMSAVKVSENELQEDKVIDVITNESVNDEGQKDEMINNSECIKDRQSEEINVVEETNEIPPQELAVEDNLAENLPLENDKQIEYNEEMYGNNEYQAEENVEQYSNVYEYDDNAVIQQQQYEDYVQQHEEYDETNQEYANNEMYQQYDENGQPIQYEEYDEQQQFVQYDENGQPIMGQEQYYNEDGQLTTTYDEELQQQYDQQLLIEGTAEEYQQQQTVEEVNEEINGEEYQQQPVEEGNEEINEQQVEEIVNQPEENATVKTVMDMLDTDTENSSVMAKQTEEAKDSDFDFSNN